jgi:hypothetical protein
MNKLAFVAAPAVLTMAAVLGTAAAGGHPSDLYDELSPYDLSLSGTRLTGIQLQQFADPKQPLVNTVILPSSETVNRR